MRWIILLLSFLTGQAQQYTLVWNEEFESLDTTFWNFEQGFVRNHEDQWYQKENEYIQDGKLIIEARTEDKTNPIYNPKSKDWRNSRSKIFYSSASLHTAAKREFLYGRFEIRAKIPTARGAWPAIWTLGSGYPWPSNGEIDIMEYYPIKGIPHLLANAAWGNDQPYTAVWNTKKIPFTHFTDKAPVWADKFHVWRMDWDKDFIRIFLDDELFNEISLENTVNGAIGEYTNPFHKPHYLLLNLALGGDNGGEIDPSAFPLQYEIDYVRVYQKTHP
jgi:beta-glucanase (GH16 family)